MGDQIQWLQTKSFLYLSYKVITKKKKLCKKFETILLQRTCNVGERIEGRAANTSQSSLRQERPRAKEGGRRWSLQDGLHWPHNHPNRAEFLPVSVYSYISPGRGSCSQSISALNYGQSKRSKIQRIGLQKNHPFIQLQSSPNLLYVYAKSPRRQQGAIGWLLCPQPGKLMGSVTRPSWEESRISPLITVI